MEEPFIIYNPDHTVRELELNRAKARSYAARVRHVRRKVLDRPKPGVAVVANEQPRAQCSCQHQCESEGRLGSAQCTRAQFLSLGESMNSFEGLPIVITTVVHEIIVFWNQPALWDCIHNYSHGKNSRSYFRLELERDILNLQNELDAVMFLCECALFVVLPP
jgi:hypothetical protein